MFLYFAMLNRSTLKQIIELYGQNSSGTGFILARFQAQPEVHIPWQLFLFIFFGLKKKEKLKNMIINQQMRCGVRLYRLRVCSGPATYI